jgi:hypothetical protein
MSFPYLIQGDNIVVVIGNVIHTVSKTHVTYSDVLSAIKAQDWDKVKEVVEPKKVILTYGKGNVSIDGDTLLWKGQEFDGYLAVRMIDMLKEGFSIDPFAAFMENLMQNPSARAVKELYGFLEKANMTITPDGCFLAFKKVDDNYYDVHSRTVLNKPYDLFTAEDFDAIKKVQGKKKEVTVEISKDGVTVVSMERNQVDDNRDNTCSEGLHFCSKDYLDSFSGSRIVILKINPRDVVSIPSDYNATKGRTCRYEVIGELAVAVNDAFTKTVQNTANGSYWPEAVATDDEWPFAGEADEPVQYTRSGSASGQTVDTSIPQEYDVKGNPLSMTKDAIRKRKARAAVKDYNSTASMLRGNNSWPQPKGF